MTAQRPARRIAFGLAGLLAAALLAAILSGHRHGLLRRGEVAVAKVKHRLGWRSASAIATLAPAAAGAAVLPVPPTTIGIHLSSPSGSDTFANLAMGLPWSVQAKLYGPWAPMPAENVNPDGTLKSIPAGSTAGYYLTMPKIGKAGLTIRCTFTGKASVWVDGPSIQGGAPQRSNSFTFRWTTQNPGTMAQLNVKDMDPARPVRDIDCREAALPRDARFTPAFLDLIKGFRVLRFMDWQNTNENNPVTWATRHTPASTAIAGGDGVAIEDMMALAQANGSDPWFNLPWQADDDYYRRFAQYVHDTLPPGHVVYLELSNEVWNESFPVGRQATQAGRARGLTDPQEAVTAAYAERVIHVMDIWSKVFADDPRRLVRILSGQAVNMWRTGLLLGYKDVTRHVDAFATAPYFNYDATGMPGDVDEIYRRLPAGIEEALNVTVQQKAAAAKHGLRFLAYEAGQGLGMADVPLLEKIERDPRMGDMTRLYIDSWRKRIGDTIIMFGTVFPINQYGAWGLVEYLGQPESEAPKLRAVRAELAR